MREGTIITPPVLERYEMKYTIPFELIEPISDFVSIYCSLDKYSEKSPDKYYQVNSLYLDTPSFLFLKNRVEGVKNRFNMRIRSYGENPQGSYFLEIKHKTVGIIKKYRAPVPVVNWKPALNPVEYIPLTSENEKELRNLRYFQYLMQAYNAEPKVLTRYRRKAYFSECEDYARVTFDIELKYMQESTFNVIPDKNQMRACDFATNYDPGSSVILELKCYTSHVPLWMIDLIRMFELHRRSFSKYMTGIREVFGSYRHADLSQQPVLF